MKQFSLTGAGAWLAMVLTLACIGSDNPDEPLTPPSPSPPQPTETLATTIPTQATPPAEPASPMPATGPVPSPTTMAQATAAASPTPITRPATVLRSLPTSQRVVALTFDAGSDDGYTRQILATLRQNGIIGGFGITGRWAEKYPDLLRAIVDDGHDLINHTYDHGSLTGRSSGTPPQTQEQRWQQLDRTEAIVQALASATTLPFFRPPFGDYDDGVNADIAARGYAFNVMWTVDSFGWNGASVDEIVARCLSLTTPGAILIFHVGSASLDGPALQAVIDGLRSQGYGFASLQDLE